MNSFKNVIYEMQAQLDALNSKMEQNDHMEVDEGLKLDEPFDLIELVCAAYGSRSVAYLNMISNIHPGEFDPSEISAKSFRRKLESIFKYLPKVFNDERTKIAFLNSNSPGSYQRQIKEILKTPGSQETFTNVFNQVFLNEREKSWFSPVPKFLNKGARGELDVDQIHKWMDTLDKEATRKAMIFALHSDYYRNELLNHNYERGNLEAIVNTVNNQVQYRTTRKPFKGYSPNNQYQSRSRKFPKGNERTKSYQKSKPKNNSHDD